MKKVTLVGVQYVKDGKYAIGHYHEVNPKLKYEGELVGQAFISDYDPQVPQETINFIGQDVKLTGYYDKTGTWHDKIELFE